MSDALKAYQFIVENVASWIGILESLQSKIKEREEHVSRVPVPARSLKKSGSNESIRPASQEKDLKLEVLSAPQDGHMANPFDGQYLSPHNRKRRTASIASTDSIPAKFRTRSMIIVYYDSEIEKTFEQVVRHIGTARNQLRRARTTMQMNALITGRDIPSPASQSGNIPLTTFRSSRSMPNNGYHSAATSEKSSDSLTLSDAALEKAQSFCERGAHQFLREGDCEAEISGAEASFLEAKRLAEQEIESSKQDSDDAASSEAGETRKGRLGPHLRGFLQNGGIEMDSDPDDGEEVDDPMMKLVRHSTRRAGGAPLSVPA